MCAVGPDPQGRLRASREAGKVPPERPRAGLQPARPHPRSHEGGSTRRRRPVAKVSLRGIRKHFGRTALFQGFDLDVFDGELLCLLGPSGSGKTTLLRLIAGLETLDDGEIHIGERDVSRLSPRHRQIGMMFQGYALYPHLSVRENLAYPLRVRHAPAREIEPRVAETARMLGIEHLLDRRIQQISGGEQQRVAIGRAIIQKPQLYLLDEPISNLDASLREAVRTEIRRLQRQLGATMIMVTHDQLDALAIADRIAAMRAGVLQQCGTPEELYLSPVNLFVASFIGRLRMNLLACTYAGGDELRGEGFAIPVPPEARPALAGHGGALVVGFRPEAVDLARAATSAGARATVETVQFQGDRLICGMTLGTQPILVSLDPREHAAPGEAVWLTVQPRQMHLFDRESGARLSMPAALAGEASEIGGPRAASRIANA
jgi:multiple sugar transport system ATP-binding protein